MMRPWFVVAWLLMVGLPAIATAEPPFRFRDVAPATGVRKLAANMNAHAAAWGDADGDGLPDLYVGAFHKTGTEPNVLLLQREGRFVAADQPALAVSARSSGAIFVDLDNDGDQDLYVSNLGGGKEGHQATDSKLFRNDGGKFVDISSESHACPQGFRGRSVAALDYDGDGRLDLLLGESLAYGSAKHSRLLRNRGDLKFEDVTKQVGLPPTPALGVAVGDVNNDRWPDLLLVAAEGGNRLFLNRGGKDFREAAASKVLQAAWKYSSGDDTTSAAVMADVDRDGRLDLILGHHFERPWLTPVPIRLYLNRGMAKGESEPTFEDVTEASGLVGLPMKAAHVEVQDFDNDGWPDIYVSIVKFAGDAPHPVIFRNLGRSDGKLRFECAALGVNDFPNDADRAIQRTGTFFQKMVEDRRITYTAAAPSCDFDRDGKIDLFISSWWTELPAMLLKNETAGGNYLRVEVRGDEAEKVSRDGVGARIEIYPSGKANDADALLGMQEIAVGYGYSSGQEAAAHFGLGQATEVDVVVRLPGQSSTVERSGIKVNQRIVLDVKSSK